MKGFLQSLPIVAIILYSGATAALAQTPVIAAGGVLNAASNDKSGKPLAPGSLVTIYGTDLSAATASADSIPLSTQLSSVKVSFNGIDATIKDVVHNPAGGDQINAQVPWEILPLLPPGTSGTVQVPVVVTRNGVTSNTQNVTVGAADPAIFTTAFGVGQAIAYGNSDFAYAAPVNAGLPSTSHPAKIGDPQSLAILATGLGAVDSTVKDGDVPSVPFASTLTKPTVLVGGVPAQVLFAILVGRDATTGKANGFVSVYQINIIISPNTPTGDAVPLQIQMNGGAPTTDKVTIAVSQ